MRIDGNWVASHPRRAEKALLKLLETASSGFFRTGFGVSSCLCTTSRLCRMDAHSRAGSMGALAIRITDLTQHDIATVTFAAKWVAVDPHGG